MTTGSKGRDVGQYDTSKDKGKPYTGTGNSLIVSIQISMRTVMPRLFVGVVRSYKDDHNY